MEVGMHGRLYLVHWNVIEAEQRSTLLEADGWNVSVEPEDGGRAYEFIKRENPDVVVIDLSRKPAHGRKVARSVRTIAGIDDIPIVFVDGSREERELTVAEISNAHFVTASDLLAYVTRFAKGIR
jgi:CheY-like chemotaxis protein